MNSSSYFFELYFSSCIDETQLCKGFPLCQNKIDLKWCRNTSSLSDPNVAEWKPIDTLSICNRTPQVNGTTPHGQWIKVAFFSGNSIKMLVRSSKFYLQDHCFQFKKVCKSKFKISYYHKVVS